MVSAEEAQVEYPEIRIKCSVNLAVPRLQMAESILRLEAACAEQNEIRMSRWYLALTALMMEVYG